MEYGIIVGVLFRETNPHSKYYEPEAISSWNTGILTNEIRPKTMESKIVSGLYFAGEIIDLDAETGGYNLQIAYSTGWLAGNSFQSQ